MDLERRASSFQKKDKRTDFLFSESDAFCVPPSRRSPAEGRRNTDGGRGEPQRKTAIFCSFPPIPSSEPPPLCSFQNKPSLSLSLRTRSPHTDGHREREREREEQTLFSFNTMFLQHFLNFKWVWNTDIDIKRLIVTI